MKRWESLLRLKSSGLCSRFRWNALICPLALLESFGEITICGEWYSGVNCLRTGELPRRSSLLSWLALRGDDCSNSATFGIRCKNLCSESRHRSRFFGCFTSVYKFSTLSFRFGSANPKSTWFELFQFCIGFRTALTCDVRSGSPSIPIVLSLKKVFCFVKCVIFDSCWLSRLNRSLTSRC